MNLWEIRCRLFSYIKFNHSIKIDEINFYKDENNCQRCTFFVQADSSTCAREAAMTRIERILQLLAFVADIKFDFVITDVVQQIDKGEVGYGESDLCCAAIITKEISDDTILELRKIMLSERASDIIASATINYYSQGLKLGEWYTEAFINYFKVIELISDAYLEEAKVNKIEENKDDINKYIIKITREIDRNPQDYDKIMKVAGQIYDIGRVERRRRILMAVNDLNAKEFEPYINKLVKLRNEVSAHADSQCRVLTEADVALCKEFARKLMLGYLNRQ